MVWFGMRVEEWGRGDVMPSILLGHAPDAVVMILSLSMKSYTIV